MLITEAIIICQLVLQKLKCKFDDRITEYNVINTYFDYLFWLFDERIIEYNVTNMYFDYLFCDLKQSFRAIK